MRYTSLLLALSAGLGFSSPTNPHSLDPKHYHPNDIIRRDVAVIGGGSTGTYTAVRLKDHGKSVVVIEKKEKLGGHAETYTAPNGYTLNLGVVVFAKIKVVENYFSRFNVPLIQLPSGPPSLDYTDFTTGKKVDFKPADADAQAAAFKIYREQLEKYPALQHGFNMSYPVAQDLLLTFGEFVKKYELGAIVPTAFIYNQGYGQILDVPVLYIFKYLNANQLDSTANGYLTTKNHNTYALYAAAGKHLGEENVLTGSTPIWMDRSSCPVKILVQTPKGKKLILAEKVVSTIPPTLKNLHGYDLSAEEKDLFGQWKSNGYYTAILNNTGLYNASFDAAQPGRPYDVPDFPTAYLIESSPTTNLTQVFYGSQMVLSDDAAKAGIEKTLYRLQAGQGLPHSKPEFVAYSSHSPFNLEVSTKAIEDRFYERLFALNGKMNTFFNGAAFHTQDSSVLWQFTEDYVLPMILRAL